METLAVAAMLMMQPALGTCSGQEGANVYTVRVPLHEFVAGYLRWEHNHPGVVPSGESLKLRMPSLDLYSGDGPPLYYGTSSAKNAEFIRGLPGGMPRSRVREPRPTLREAIEMLPELRRFEAALLSHRGDTLLAVTYPRAEFCKAQNDAVSGFRKRADRLRISVVEVELQE